MNTKLKNIIDFLLKYCLALPLLLIFVLYFCLSFFIRSIMPVQAQEFTDGRYTFGFEIPDGLRISFIQPEKGYKTIRLWEITHLMPEYGLGATDAERDLLLAHLLRECGSLSEECGWEPGSDSNDSGWAIGMAQWHLWYRENDLARAQGCRYTSPRVWQCDIPKLRAAFFSAHPEMKDWRGQVARYLTEIRDCTKDRSLVSCIDSWNAHPAYMSQVRAQIPEARRLLSL